MDHDQRFKILIQVFFHEFLLLFFKSWAERLDATAVEWLDKEVFPDPPQGQRQILDLVGKLPTRQGVPGQRPGEPESWLALVHIEIESPDKATLLRPRMYDAYAHLRRKYGLPVLPIALYLRVGLDGVGIDVYEEHFWELRPVRFEYLYVGLPALDGLKYVEGENWLGCCVSSADEDPQGASCLAGRGGFAATPGSAAIGSATVSSGRMRAGLLAAGRRTTAAIRAPAGQRIVQRSTSDECDTV